MKLCSAIQKNNRKQRDVLNEAMRMSRYLFCSKKVFDFV